MNADTTIGIHSDSARPVSIRALRDELEFRRRKAMREIADLVDHALERLQRHLLREAADCATLDAVRDLKDDVDFFAISDGETLADKIERELERADMALLRELKRVGANGSGGCLTRSVRHD
jgi:hypothetical protein